jgi:hypothetical protein
VGAFSGGLALRLSGESRAGKPCKSGGRDRMG